MYCHHHFIEYLKIEGIKHIKIFIKGSFAFLDHRYFADQRLRRKDAIKENKSTTISK